MKTKIGVLFGGQSAEHDISICSAQSVIQHLDLNKYDILPIGIDKKGTWLFFCKDAFLSSIQQNHIPTLQTKNAHFPLVFSKPLGEALSYILKEKCDVIFPLLHGPYGEDGSMQGLLQLANLPYVGSDTLSSSICMDKIITKELLKAANLPISSYIALHSKDLININMIIANLSLPLFVKPANLGSSIGINKVHTKEQLRPCINEAFLYDEHVLIEEHIEGKEIECAILGNLDPLTSLPGQILPTHEFYSYTAKYIDAKGAEFQVPASLTSSQVQKIQKLGIQAYKTLRCEGMARIDFFLKENGKIIINEINTIPGFTTISLYPRLWGISGIPYSKLLDRLIDLAIERFKRKQVLHTSYSNTKK